MKTMTKTARITALLLLTLLSGCATGAWQEYGTKWTRNDLPQNAPEHLDEGQWYSVTYDKDVPPGEDSVLWVYMPRIEDWYFRGTYLGTRTIGNTLYYHYIFPNAYNDPDTSSLDIMYPETRGKKAIVSHTKNVERNGKPAYIRYESLLHPKTWAREATLRLMREGKLGSIEDLQALESADYPAYVSVYIPFSNNRLAYADIYCGAALQRDNAGKCKGLHGRGGNVQGSSRPMNGPQMLHSLGYVVTVPVDIVTSPVQLIGFLIYLNVIESQF
jgi:hypothetical protein